MKEILKQFFLKIKAKFYNKTEIDTALSGKSDISHNHDDRYYTETEITNKLAEKSDIGHKHSADDITSGALPIANGGTGATTAHDAFMTLANGLLEGSNPEDTEHIIFKNSSGKDWGLYTLSHFWEYIKGKISSVLGLTKDNYGGKASTAGTADTAETATKAVEVVDYGDTLRTIKIGYEGPGITADKLLHLAGYTRDNDSSVKIKDVNREEIIKWLGIPRVKYADYTTDDHTFSSMADYMGIDLSKFGPDVREDNVLSFMVIQWSGIPVIAQADWAATSGSSGLKCQLHPFTTGTGHATIRCVYLA